MAVVRAVGAVIVDDSGRILLIQRGHEPSAGLWTVPGGRLEPGESDEAALRREIREETGLDVVVGPVAGRLVREGPGGATYAITDYVCRVTGGSAAAGDDAADLRWVTRDELAALPTTERLAQLLSDWGVF
jgi:ADP-ribose pyrophosphatase YjhB (NUDIX family)